MSGIYNIGQLCDQTVSRGQVLVFIDTVLDHHNVFFEREAGRPSYGPQEKATQAHQASR